MPLPALFRSPRFLLGSLLLVSGGAALAASTGLLKLQLHAMWLRYGLATIAGYLVFITGLAYLVRKHRKFVRRPTRAFLEPAPAPPSLKFSTNDLGVGDLLGAFDDLPGFLVVLGLLLLGLVAFLIFGAAGVLAELALDAVVVGAAWKRINRSLSDDWTLVFKRTLVWGAAVVVAMSLAALLVQRTAPGAITLGQALGLDALPKNDRPKRELPWRKPGSP